MFCAPRAAACLSFSRHSYSAIWPTQRVGTSAQPRVSHCIADHEWRCRALHKHAQTELAHIGYRSTPVRPPASVYEQHEVWPRADGCVRTVPPARCRARTAARGKAPSVDGVTAGVRPGHAEQAIAGGAPSGFSRIQIAWCAGCWPTSPRPQGSHLPFHTTAGHRSTAGPKVRYCHDQRPVTGSPRRY
jgi:hypothetical protein